MFITNLTKRPIGVNGVINLAPYEVNRYIDDKNKDLVARVVTLEAAKLVAVVREPGLTKTGIPGKVIKTIGVDAKGLSKAPRTAQKEAAKVVAPAVKVEAKAPVEAPVEVPAEVPVEAPVEAPEVEAKPAKASKVRPIRAAKAKPVAEPTVEAAEEEKVNG